MCHLPDYTHLMIKTRKIRLLQRLLDPVTNSLNEVAARKLIGLRANKKTQAYVDRLARKCNAGELTPAERSEYETLVIAADFVAILKAKARLLLARRGKSS